MSNNDSHCGRCNNPCPYRTHCVNSKCVCDEGFGDCDGNANNGCEAAFNTDKDNCGECGKKCELQNVKNAFCKDKSCDYNECLIEYTDADKDRTNGCETWSYFPKVYYYKNINLPISVKQLSNGNILLVAIIGDSIPMESIINVVSILDRNGEILFSRKIFNDDYLIFINDVEIDSNKKIILSGFARDKQRKYRGIIIHMSEALDIITAKLYESDGDIKINNMQIVEGSYYIDGSYNSNLFISEISPEKISSVYLSYNYSSFSGNFLYLKDDGLYITLFTYTMPTQYSFIAKLSNSLDNILYSKEITNGYSAQSIFRNKSGKLYIEFGGKGQDNTSFISIANITQNAFVLTNRKILSKDGKGIIPNFTNISDTYIDLLSFVIEKGSYVYNNLFIRLDQDINKVISKKLVSNLAFSSSIMCPIDYSGGSILVGVPSETDTNSSKIVIYSINSNGEISANCPQDIYSEYDIDIQTDNNVPMRDYTISLHPFILNENDINIYNSSIDGNVDKICSPPDN